MNNLRNSNYLTVGVFVEASIKSPLNTLQPTSIMPVIFATINQTRINCAYLEFRTVIINYRT